MKWLTYPSTQDLIAASGMAPEQVAAWLQDERRKVVRCFQRYTGQQQSDRRASFRLGYKQRVSTGEYYYVHPDAPGKAFPTRGDAAIHVVAAGLRELARMWGDKAPDEGSDK